MKGEEAVMGFFANLISRLNGSTELKKAQEKYLRNTKKYLGEVSANAEAMTVLAGRKQRELVECTNELEKLQRYAEKAVLAEADDDAREYLAKKFALEEKLKVLQQEYEQASLKAESLSKEKAELLVEIQELETQL